MRQIEGRTEQKPKQKETSNWWFENSQPIRISKDVQIRRYIVRKTCSGEKVKDVAGQPFGNVEEIRCVIHASPQRSQQKPGTVMGLSRKDLWRALLFNDVNMYDTQETHKVFKNVISGETLSVWTEREIKQHEKSLLDSLNSTNRKHAYKSTQLQKCANLQEKGRMTLKGGDMGAKGYRAEWQRIIHRPRSLIFVLQDLELA